jgi:4'-phosphopantetheinyl transferase
VKKQPPPKRQPPQMNKTLTVQVVFTDDMDFNDYDRFTETLPLQRQEKIKNLLREEDKLLSLTAGVLIKRNLPEEAVVKTGEFGKPFVADCPNIHFSVAHTKGAVVFIKADSPVGIDIEKIEAFDSMMKIAEKHFTPEEYSFCDNNEERFFEIWTKKEAYAKMTGYGLTNFSRFPVLGDRKIFSTRLKDFYISVCSEECKGKNINIAQITL